jgi:hypothetical protein
MRRHRGRRTASHRHRHPATTFGSRGNDDIHIGSAVLLATRTTVPSAFRWVPFCGTARSEAESGLFPGMQLIVMFFESFAQLVIDEFLVFGSVRVAAHVAA